MHLTISQRMSEIISSNMFDNAVTQDHHFLCLLWSVIFPRGSVESSVTKYYRRLLLFGLILNWYWRIITTLVFFTHFDGRVAIYVCSYNIITICVATSCHFISLKIFISVFSWFCNFFNWFKWIVYIWTEQIDILFVFFFN